MSADRVQDAIQRGLGRAAMGVGHECHAYRPRGPVGPMETSNRFLKLRAVFVRPGRTAVRAMEYGQAVWQGIFDAAYTRPGDYLRRLDDGAVWFIAAQQDLEPLMCVRAERVVEFSRPLVTGPGGYGGVMSGNLAPLLSAWPASILEGGSGAVAQAGLPGEPRGGGWRVLLPAASRVLLRGGDVMTDDLGRRGVIATAELSDMGWRLTVKQALS